MKSKIFFLVISSLGLLLLVGCGSSNRSIQEANQIEEEQVPPIKVMASIFPLADIIKQIGGDLVEVSTFLPPGASEHTYELTPQQVKDFNESELYVKIGHGLEFFDSKLMDNQEGRQLKEVVFADMVELVAVEIVTLASLTKNDKKGHSHSHDDDDDDHDHEGPDPHVWLDPVLVRDILVPAIYESLVQLRPEDGDIFAENKIRFQEQLSELNDLIVAETNTFSHRNFIVFHSAWRYFSQRYGLTDVNIEEFPSQEVSLKRVAEVVEIARLTGAKAIFAEPQFSPRAAQVIAQEFGGEVLILDPLGGPSFPGRDSYISLMEYNLQVLKEALQ
ncbi:MAG: zinc ABC transporter substrate-binding protein [Clostridia bacterium]|nr:zinc ABC transporter substrate-binding protein [Clostridia bacterium]